MTEPAQGKKTYFFGIGTAKVVGSSDTVEATITVCGKESYEVQSAPYVLNLRNDGTEP